MKKIKERINNYRKLNALSRKGAVVFFGGNFFNSLHIQELALDYSVGLSVYNRSFENLDIASAELIAEECVYEMSPSKIFVNIGESDLQSSRFDEKKFIDKYEWFLLSVHRNCRNIRIYIVSLVSDNPAVKALNQRLEILAKEVGCTFVNMNILENDTAMYVRAFNILKSYMRDFPPTFADAMGFRVV